MTHEQHLTTIAEFMGWDICIYCGVLFFKTQPHYQIMNIKSFDTMRFIYDDFKLRLKNNTHIDRFKYLFKIEESLTDGTPSDCALRLAEAIEWWKSVK